MPVHHTLLKSTPEIFSLPYIKCSLDSIRIIFANSISLLFLGLVLHKEKSEVLVVQDKNMVCTKLF